MTRNRRSPNSNPNPPAREKGSPFEQPEKGPFSINEDISVKKIETIQKGMIDAFNAGKKLEGGKTSKNNLGAIIGYLMIISSYIIAVIICFWKDRFSPEYQQTALGYIFSIVPAAFLGLTKSKE
jgi:hypothetical protein